jgi:THO complex subunit 6
VALDAAENWVAMGCGGRCITMWSFAAGACASRVATAAPPQALVMTGEHVMAAGAEPAVYRWNLAGQLISRQPCTPASVYAMALQPRSLTAAGGTGASVDLFSELGTRVCTVKCA